MKEIVKIKSISLHKLNNTEARRRVKAASEGEGCWWRMKRSLALPKNTIASA